MWVEQHRGKWRIRDRVGGRLVTIKSSIANKTMARTVMTTLEADKLRGDALVPRGGRLTLDAWLDMWWPAYEVTLKPTSIRSRRTVLASCIRPMLGPAALDDIDPVTVQQWVADLLAGRRPVARPRPLSRKTVANAHGMLHKILAEAVAARLVRTNPCERTRLPQVVHHEMRFLTEPEAGRLVAAAMEHYRPLVLTFLGTGIRWSEANGLRVADVDVLAKRIHVRHGLHRVRGVHQRTTTKTRGSMRSLAITADLAAALIPLTVGREGSDPLFTDHAGGGALIYNTFWKWWRRACADAGLDGLRIHDLRHTHAAWLISSRIRGGIAAVSRRLGHASVRMTIDLYGHLMPEVDEDIIEALEARLPVIVWGSTGGAPNEETRVA